MLPNEPKKRGFWRARESPLAEVLRGAIWPLLPIALGIGILMAKKWPEVSLSFALYIWLFCCVAVVLAFGVRRGVASQILIITIIIIIGFARLGVEFRSNKTQPIFSRYYGPIEGRVVEIDQSSSAALRLTLSNVILDGREVKGNVRISLHGLYMRERIFAGSIVQTTGHLGPPSGPSEPGGYDFRQRAWQDGLASVGYTRNPTIASAPKDPTFQDKLLTWRLGQADKYRKQLGEKIGGFAAAIFIGDRSEIDQDVLDVMRRTNLAHLLAISGMHIGTVCGLVFMTVRRGSGLFPSIANGMWGLRIAVLSAIIFGAAYWFISGMSFSSTRAFMMATLFFLGLFALRHAISLRSIALSASAILMWQPTALGDVGFQMSFAATTALVFIYGKFSLNGLRMNAVLKWILILGMTSFIAGLATAPFSAFHFHNAPKYGLLANLLAVPVMTFVVMPAGILAAILDPFGLDHYPLWVAGKGISWIISVGEYVANFDDPVWQIPKAKPAIFIAIVIAGLLAVIGGMRARVIAITILICSLIAWPRNERPMLLVADSARFFGLKLEGPRQFSRATGHSFAAENWALGDGDVFDQDANAIEKADPIIVDLKDGWTLIFTTTKKGAENVQDLCRAKTLVIAAQAKDIKGECMFFGEYAITDMGGMAVDIEKGELIVTPNIHPDQKIWERINKTE